MIKENYRRRVLTIGVLDAVPGHATCSKTSVASSPGRRDVDERNQNHHSSQILK